MKPLPPGMGRAFWFTALLLACVELALHSELFWWRYRSVFAVGRAFDKIHYIERQPPGILFLGNSRTDNGIDPRTIDHELHRFSPASFNAGLPGANAVILHGVLDRLDKARLLGVGKIDVVVIGLDESLLQGGDSLGYAAFLGARATLWREQQYRVWFGSFLRLWSYCENLRQLQEPAKAVRFLQATVASIDPVGGAANAYRGYRAGFGAAQNDEQVGAQEQSAFDPPDAKTERFFWLALDLLQARGVRVAAAIPPLRDRRSAYFEESASAAPYRAVIERLRERKVIVLSEAVNFSSNEFVNAGHLNDAGAQRFSTMIAHALAAAKFD